MAYPIANSSFLPSIADAPFLPPKLKDMPIFNPGTSCYECDDGTVRTMTEAEAINYPGSCKVVDAGRCSGAVSAPAPVAGYITGYPVLNMGRGLGIARVS